MKKIICIIGLLIFILEVQAQKSVHMIELKMSRDLGIKDFYIDEVIDMRIVNSNIGFVKKGMGNRPVEANFLDSLHIQLKSQYDKLATNTSGEPITILVHEFNISEETSAMSEKGLFRMQLEYARKIEGQLYSVWYSDNEVEGKGMDVTKGHKSRISTTIIKNLLEFKRSGWEEQKGELIDLDEEINYDLSQVPKKGLYSSFSKLAKNSHLDIADFKLAKLRDTRFPTYKILDVNGKKYKKRVMYASDGTNIYINSSAYHIGNYFIKSKEIGKYLYFEDRYSDPLAGAAFGLLGAAASNTPKAIVVDTETGIISRMNEAQTKTFLSKYPNAYDIYKSNKSTGKRMDALRKAIMVINEEYRGGE